MQHYQIPQEEPCPVPESMLSELYRAKPEGLQDLIESVSPFARAMLAIYCRRRAHLGALGLALAATCDKDDLINAGGDFGAMLFEQARRTPGGSINSTREGLRKVLAQDLI